MIRYKPGTYRSEFASFLASNHRYQILYGGRGSGKTAHVFYKLFMTSFLAQRRGIYYGRHQMETLRRTTFQDMVNFLRKTPHLSPFFEYSRANNSPMIFRNKITGLELRPFGMDDPDTLKGLSEATDVFIDEIDKTTIEQFQAVDSIIRTGAVADKQLIAAFNPIDEGHWLREMFFDENDPYAPNRKLFGDRLFIHHSTCIGNPFIDWEDYVRTLMINSGGRSNYINVNIYGFWGVPENANPWAYAWDEKKHIGDNIKIANSYPIHLSFDFNRRPLTCTAWQRSETHSGPGAFCYGIKEFTGDMQLKDMCDRIRAYFPGKVLTVTGDASGRKGDIAFEDKNASYYTEIKRFLNLGARQMLLNSHNLTHNDSYNLVNHVLYHHPNFKISREGCPLLIRDIQAAEIDTKSKQANALRKDRGAFKMDLMDTFRYFAQTHLGGMLKNIK